MISVALTVRNARDTISNQLEALAAQVANRPWEVVISDGGSTDGTLELIREWINHSGIDARLLQVGRPGIAAGRNVAVEATVGDSVLFCDADDIVAPGWLRSMAVALDESRLVIGQVHLVHNVPVSSAIDAALASGWQGSIVGPGKRTYNFLPTGLTANLGVSKSLLEELGGFDETLDTGEDVDFVWRAQELGEVPKFCDGGVVFKRRRSRPADRFRQHYRFGRSDPQLYRRHRPYGMPSSVQNSIRAWTWLIVKAPSALYGKHRSEWASVLGHRLGRLEGSVKHRTLYL